MKQLTKNLFFIFLLTACVSQAVPATPTPTTLPEPTATNSPQISVKIISYNILFGGGILPEWDELIQPSGLHGDRTPEIFAYLREIDADVIALQEVYGWNDTEPPFIETAANAIGLPNYYVAPSSEDHDTAILTRYEILETESLYEAIGDPSVLRARLQTPDGNPLNVFVVHFWAMHLTTTEFKECQVRELAEAIEPYKYERTIVLGDFNFQAGPFYPEFQLMESMGLEFVTASTIPNMGFRIDQIWIPTTAPSWVENEWDYTIENSNKLSDHNPVGLAIDFYEYEPGIFIAPTKEAGAYLLPNFITTILDNPQISGEITFENFCVYERWFPNETPQRFQGETFVLPGKENWSSGTSFPVKIEAGQGFLMKFKAKESSEFTINITTGGQWGEETYREAGLYFSSGESWPFFITGSDQTLPPENKLFDMQPEQYYWLSFLVQRDGSIQVLIQDTQDLTQAPVSFEFASPDGNQLTEEWQVNLGANLGVLTIDDFARFSFDGLK